MRTLFLAGSVALGLVAAATQAQIGPAVIIQRTDGTQPSTIPRLPATQPAPMPVVQPPMTPSVPAPEHQGQAREQRKLVEAIQQMSAEQRAGAEAKLKERGTDPQEVEQAIREGKLVPKSDELSIYRVIIDELKPIPISGGALLPVFPQTSHSWGTALDSAESVRISTASRSVGRIEMGTSPFRLKGTGFVIGEGLIATNCHVLRKIARPEGNGWTLAGPALIDFADSAEHEPAREFRIEGIQAFPQVPYLDVAILRVAATSSNGANRLPARLRVQRTPFEIIEGQPDRLVAVIGYPDLDDVSLADPLTQNVYRRLREVGTVAQTLSLGAITGIDRHQGIDFVDHAASTHMGQSGSPVIDRNTGAVVAVHYCCANPNAPPDPSPLACSSQGLSDRENNEAVSMWTVVRDPILGPLFPLDAAASIPAILHGGPIRSTRR